MAPKSTLLPFVCVCAVLNLSNQAANPREPGKDPSPFTQEQAVKAENTATELLMDLLSLDAAVDQWAIENNKRKGAMPTPQDLVIYVKKGTHLHAELMAGRLNDILGNPIILRGVDSPPLISKKSVEPFASVVKPGFWGVFYEGPEPSKLPPAPPAQPPVAPANPITKTELQTTATRLLQEMRLVDAAMDQWAIEHNKRDGDQPKFSDLIAYIKPGTRLHRELAAGQLNDSLGNPITIPPLGKVPMINEATAKKLSSAVPDSFWGPFLQK